MNAVPAALADIAAATDARLVRLLDVERARWAAVDDSLGGFVDLTSSMVLNGGKRLRPAFCHWAHRAAGGDPDDPVLVDAQAALELLHAFALAHDDVMDGAELRRGQPAIHRHRAEHHASEGWAGESRRFGDAVAILVGDYLHVLADGLIAGAGAHTETVWRDLWTELRTELNVGQYLDVLGAANRSLTAEAAQLIVRYKSGRYTIERPLELGATLAGDRELGMALGTYGEPLGEAFQLRDDVLGCFGDPVELGKPVGDDLREGKATLLLAFAREAADPEQADLLARVGGALTATEVTAIGEVFVATGALDQVERRIAHQTEAAIAALDQLTLPADARIALVELAHFVSARRF